MSAIAVLAIITGNAPHFQFGVDQRLDPASLNESIDFFQKALEIDGYKHHLVKDVLMFTDEFGSDGGIVLESATLCYSTSPEFAVNEHNIQKLNDGEPRFIWDHIDADIYAEGQLANTPDVQFTANAIQGASMIFFARTHPSDPRAQEIIIENHLSTLSLS